MYSSKFFRIVSLILAQRYDIKSQDTQLSVNLVYNNWFMPHLYQGPVLYSPRFCLFCMLLDGELQIIPLFTRHINKHEGELSAGSELHHRRNVWSDSIKNGVYLMLLAGIRFHPHRKRASYEECCVRSRFQGQGQVITSLSICGV